MEKAEKNVESKSGNSFDAEHFKEGLAKQIKAAGGVHAFYAQGDFLKQLTKSAMEVMLEAEMDMHLGFEKNSSEAIATTNRRNGKDRKTVTYWEPSNPGDRGLCIPGFDQIFRFRRDRTLESYLRTKDDAEIDSIIERPGMPIICSRRLLFRGNSTRPLHRLQAQFLCD